MRACVSKRRRRSTIAKAVVGAMARGLSCGRDDASRNPGAP
jgi:hypothetical protein